MANQTSNFFSSRWPKALTFAAVSLAATVGLVGARPAHSFPASVPVPSVQPVIVTGSTPVAAEDAAASLVANQPLELLHDSASVAPSAEPSISSPAFSTARPGSARVLWMEVTAYCGCKKCCGPHAQGLTASGRSIAYNGGVFVAADTSLLPFGTLVQIPGYGHGEPVEVIDRGSAIKGHRIDVFFPTHEQARAWGRRWIAVTVVE